MSNIIITEKTKAVIIKDPDGIITDRINIDSIELKGDVLFITEKKE